VFSAIDDAVATEAAESESLVRLVHKTIKGVTEDMERFRFNVAISKLQVLTNEMRSALDAGGGARSAAGALTQLLAPFAPYAAEELWRAVLGHETSVHASSWPTFDPAQVVDDIVTMVVQVDGKLRDKMDVAVDITEADALALARASARVAAAIGDREVVKEIVRVPKLVNLVTRG
jgi:leucyl-tRNA synthetase